jgi:hypothetical protein
MFSPERRRGRCPYHAKGALRAVVAKTLVLTPCRRRTLDVQGVRNSRKRGRAGGSNDQNLWMVLGGVT